MVTAGERWYGRGFGDGYEEARWDLLDMLAKRQPSHEHRIAGSYECHQCTTGLLAVVLAWLGVDASLEPIVDARTRGHADEDHR